MSDEPDAGVGEMRSETRARWEALKDAVGDLATAADDPDGFGAAFAALAQVGRSIDMAEVIDAVHVPEDAGEHADALRRMLLRIPGGWGRWIGCSRGWYRLVVELDERIGALFPAYQLEQVKEKFGGLRYYWSPDQEITNPADPEPIMPSAGGDGTGSAEAKVTWSEWEAAYELWCGRLDTYLQSDEGVARQDAFGRRLKLAEELVSGAERLASTTCELCGEPGRMCHTSGSSPWYKTLCAECAKAHHYAPTGPASG